MRDRMNSQDLEKLRSWRVKPDRDVSIAKEVGDAARQVTAQQKRVGGITEAWESLVPPALRRSCTVVSMTGGMLSVKASNAGARFQFDRWLRGGGEAALLKSGGVKRVKVS